MWVEVKKIATGRHADSLFRVMVELGVTNHIGWHMEIVFYRNLYFFPSIYCICTMQHTDLENF